jgi:hypothetical protein
MAWIKARTRTRIRKYQDDRNGIKTDDKIDCYKTRIPLKTKTRTRNPRTRISTRKTGSRPGKRTGSKPATVYDGLVQTRIPRIMSRKGPGSGPGHDVWSVRTRSYRIRTRTGTGTERGSKLGPGHDCLVEDQDRKADQK